MGLKDIVSHTCTLTRRNLNGVPVWEGKVCLTNGKVYLKDGFKTPEEAIKWMNSVSDLRWPIEVNL